MNQRLMVYRKVAAARSEKELDIDPRRGPDRYGALPDSVLNLAEYGRIRVMADRLGVDTIDREGRLVVIKFRPQAKVDPVRLDQGGSRVARGHAGAAGVAEARPGGRSRPETEGCGPARSPRPRPDGGSRRPSGRPEARLVGEASWWTARATAGEVTAGFTKEEILRKPEANPRAEGGMFARLEELLTGLGLTY